ncbi:MAG: alpha-mannosidase [Chloroflexi bacterium HGW-Chloroflexi-2]|jgi:alpha-mannosidase|nr:MAG: alpha-mannosidase [Chloroflexi bacterium HGW-Chloroflexi-2]
MYHQHRWTLEKLKARLALITPLAYIEKSPLPPFYYHELPGPSSKPDLEPDLSSWTIVHPNSYWGNWQTNFQLYTTFRIPEGWDFQKPIAIQLPLGGIEGDFSHPEALAYVDGVPYAACDRHHKEILLRPAWHDNHDHTLILHGWTGLGYTASGDPKMKLQMGVPQLVQIHSETREFCALARVTLSTIENLTEDNPAKSMLLNVINDAFSRLDTSHPLETKFYESVIPAYEILNAGIQKSGIPMDVIIHASGHAHIDVAWLWTLGQTRRKAERTFHNVIRYMEQFPKYHFSQSQPQLYQFIEEDQPQLFEQIQNLVTEGRWEPMGGMWVEADCNISGAESLARQFLLGRTYFKEKFGENADTPVLWLPDVFGYAWALPQLIEQAGLKYFMTIKIGWNQYNRIPYDTFLWQGIDGTQILTHFSTVKELDSNYASTYNSMANPQEALGTWNNFQQKELHNDLLMAYGFGDGGGGPTLEMLENLEIIDHFPALPQVQHSSVKKFFETIEPVQSSKMLPVWNGELYLEYHRGTFTSQALMKKNNRKSEFLIHDVEFLASLASTLDKHYQYPRDEINTAWKTICLHQFHDILPGSSIGEVYSESNQAFQALTASLKKIQQNALDIIKDYYSGDILLINPTPFQRTDLVLISDLNEVGFTREGKNLPTQLTDKGILVDPGILWPYSVTPIEYTKTKQDQFPEIMKNASKNFKMDNNLIHLEFNQDGDVISIFDKEEGREILPSHAVANQFQIFEDRPLTYDAWDIDIYYDDKMDFAEAAESITWIEFGPLRQTIEIKRKIAESIYTQRISITKDSKQIDFDTTIDWQERYKLLKVAFPVDILAPVATYEIQWGNVQRNTHRNTSWDWARFETCAHKWVDLSEGNYGVSLLNDCKYGHDIHNNVMRLSLLRGPTVPDPLADLGTHQFKYSLLPHSNSWDERTQAAAYALNDPIIVYMGSQNLKVQSGTSEKSKFKQSLFSVSNPNVVIETIKRAEDGDGLIIRLFESQRKRCLVVLKSFIPIHSAVEINLLEENQEPCTLVDHEIHLSIKPYEIKTLRIHLG